MIQTVLLILALVCFLMAAIGRPPVPINLVALGLFFLVLAQLAGAPGLRFH